jgi:hypothetical protein
VKLTTRHLFRGKGAHRPQPAGPVLTAPDPDAIWIPCHTTRCAHMTTRHDEVAEDRFRCRVCKRTTTGGE